MPIMNLPGPKARALVERDELVISPSYPRDYPFVMDKGRGVEVWDVDGNRFLDFAAGIAVVSTGHSHPRVVKAIQDQADRFLHISSDFYHPLWVELGERFDEIAPFTGDAMSFMTNSGTESVEGAIKLARHHTGRSVIIGFLGAFHGRTMGAVTLTASKPIYHQGFFPLMNGVFHAPYPDPYRPILETAAGEDDGEAVVRYIEEQLFGHLVPPEEVAGIIVEPIQGEGGYIVPPSGFFPTLRNLCDRYGILLIADEVQSGMGRTGKWWAIEHFGVEPDIVCAAKGIASGIPLGAVIAKKEIMSWPRGAHGNTYGGNPIACRLAGINVDRWRLVVYGIGGLFAGFAGYMLSSLVGSAMANAAIGAELDIIAAVILGGASLSGGEGNLIGTFLGTLVLGTLTNGLIMVNVQVFWQMVARGTALMLALFIDARRSGGYR